MVEEAALQTSVKAMIGTMSMIITEKTRKSAKRRGSIRKRGMKATRRRRKSPRKRGTIHQRKRKPR